MRIKRIASLVLTMALGGTLSLSAQSATASMAATARVQSAVSFSSISNLDFGAAAAPGTAIISTPANGGKAMVTYNTPTTITVTGSSLAHTTLPATLAVTYACAQATTGTSTTPTAFPGSCAAGYTTALAGNARTSHWIYVGGTIAAAETATAPAGVYNGSITLTATYTTF